MTTDDVQLETSEEEIYTVSSTGYFLKITGTVTAVLVAVILISSPSLYLGVSEDTPQYHEMKAKNYLQQEQYEKAVEEYKQVLKYEPSRKDIFVRADHQIKTLKQLISRQKAAAEAVEEQEKKEKEKKKEEGKEEKGTKESEEGEKEKGKDKKDETTSESKEGKTGSETDDSTSEAEKPTPEEKPEKPEQPESKKKDTGADTETDLPSPDDATF